MTHSTFLRCLLPTSLVCVLILFGQASVSAQEHPSADPAAPEQTSGSISGSVVSSTTGTPIGSGVRVFAFSQDMPHFSAGHSDANAATGQYVISLPPGSYAVFAQQSSGALPLHVAEYYDDVSVWSFAGLYPYGWTTAPVTLVTVEEGQDTPGIDFVLDRGGSLSGTVSVAGGGTTVPLPNTLVDLFHVASGRWVQGPFDPDTFTFRGLPTGDYVVVTRDASRLVDEVYDNTPCEWNFGCDPIAVGDPIHVVATFETSGIDFVLDHGGWISGTVRDGITGDLISAQVNVFALDGSMIVATTDGIAGPAWETRQDCGLTTGSYVVRVVAGGEVWLYGDVPCPDCDPGCYLDCPFPPSTPVSVAVGQETSGIEITVFPSGGIFGDGFESGGIDRWSTSTP